jgi:hypothetical protein
MCIAICDRLQREQPDDCRDQESHLSEGGHHQQADLYDALGRSAESARERATHVERRLEELGQGAVP